jgi:threonine aldolase
MNASTIDLRSDTVTQPTPQMWDAMRSAKLGDDVLGDDPTVQQLEREFAELLGKPAACFVPSGTMGNQIALRAHTEPGDEIIAHHESHIIHYEGGGPAALSGCLVRSINTPRGLFDREDMEPHVRGCDVHFPVTKLVVLENTQNRGGGAVWPLEQVRRVTIRSRELGLKTHLDGARLWNASVASGHSMQAYADCFDTVTCCFSKGLGTPVGSVLAGDIATIARARRFRKMFGGGMRQAGMLAAACLYAMHHHVARLSTDHDNARLFANEIIKSPLISLAPDQAKHGVETNIVYFELTPHPTLSLDARALCETLKSKGVLMLATGPRRVRAVTHLNVDRDQVFAAAQAVLLAVR